MEYRTLGAGGPEVSVICFGAWAMGGTGWGQVEDEDTTLAARKAFELGVNFFDTADVYGPGHSEEVLGRSVADFRSEILIATKGGRRCNEAGGFYHDASPQWLRQAIDESLRRLGTDYVDLYQLHWPDPDVPIEDSVGALKEIRDAGKARFIGVSNCGLPELERARSVCEIASNQVPLSMFFREYEAETLPYCRREGIGVMTYGPLAQGLLTGKFSRGHQFGDDDFRAGGALFQGEVYERNLGFVEALRPVAQGVGKSLGQVAINWVLSHPEVTCAICGAKRPSQIEENVGGAGWALSAEDLQAIGKLLPPSHDSPRPLK